ncbi:MAG: hypothetical protein R3195_06740 [Gemmatimonadota bacterium]|nr:hypothetical protein [Gemmatimonadota bacterium]
MTTLFFGDMLPPPRRKGERNEHVLVGTASPVQLDVRPIEHHLTPEGSICIGTFHEGRPIGRCAIPAESVEDFLEMDLFDEPVSLALNVRQGGPGVEGSLLALVPMDRAREDIEGDGEEPWRTSVPGASYDLESGEEEELAEDGQLVGIFLGEVVRFGGDRKNKESLLREAADMLAGVIRGQVGSVVDRVIEDLTTQPGG